MAQGSVVKRPPVWEERLSLRLFLALSPRLPRAAPPETPRELAPFEHVAVERPEGGTLAATWFPAPEPARGAVLLLHPWTVFGQAYFHRRGRIEALRAAGYHALTLDFSGFGHSGRPAGFFDRDVEAGLRFLRWRVGGLPVHVWGVSFGGYWAHTALSRSREVAGAVFEDVAPHMLEWSWRVAPWGRPFYLFFRTFFSRAYRYLDARLHAPALNLDAVAYVGGDKDPGIPATETRRLARRAGGDAECQVRIVRGAGHLGAIKLATEEIFALAFETFRKAEAAGRVFWSSPAPDAEEDLPAPIDRARGSSPAA